MLSFTQLFLPPFMILLSSYATYAYVTAHSFDQKVDRHIIHSTVEPRISGIFGHSEIFHYCEVIHYFGCSFFSIQSYYFHSKI